MTGWHQRATEGLEFRVLCFYHRLAPTGHGNISIAAEAVPAFDSRSDAEQLLSQQLARSELTENHGSPTGQAKACGSQSVCASVPPGEQSGVGRCRYTEIPRTAKVRSPQLLPDKGDQEEWKIL